MEASAIDEREQRVLKRALNPKEEIENYFITNNNDAKIQNHMEYIKQLLNEPVKEYIKLKERLQLNGSDANFPEFEGVVAYLTDTIFKGEVYEFLNTEPYRILLDILINKLLGIQIDGRFNYPYATTLYCIESMLELIDIYYRKSYKPTSKDVNENIGPFYHIFRYRSYLTTFLHSKHGIPDNIIFPTCYNLGATDLIIIRCVPTTLLGVSSSKTSPDFVL